MAVGINISDILQDKHFLQYCFYLTDLYSIQDKGVAVFREIFYDKQLFAWNSIAKGYDGGLYVLCVPFLQIKDGVIVLEWRDLDSFFHKSVFLLRESSETLTA